MNTVVNQLRTAFRSRKTLDLKFRVDQLKKLEEMFTEHKDDFIKAFIEDFKKAEHEILIEYLQVLSCIKYTLKNLKSWTNPKNVPKDIAFAFTSVQTVYEPYGVSLVISPWNFPLVLAFEPFIASIAAGNCTILKPSEMTPKLSETCLDLISKYLDQDCYRVVCGDKEVATELLAQKFDYIFFTGSTVVGRVVSLAAAKNLTPITLELGGKCPCYIDKNVDLDHAVNKVLMASTLNAGQVCISVDYCLCHEDVYEEFIKKLKETCLTFFGEDPQKCTDYGRIINENHFNRLANLLENTKGKIIHGGTKDKEDLYISPTFVTELNYDDILMESEIFGPIVPIFVVKDKDEAINQINDSEKPLTIYVMSNNDATWKDFKKYTSSGHCVLNESQLYYTVKELPFGGVGESGMGKYHGKRSIETFSNTKSLYAKKTYFKVIENLSNLPITQCKLSIMKKFI